MNWKREWKPLAAIVAAFLSCFYLPVGVPRFDHAVMESLHLVKWYAQEHVILCLLPAFFIAGAISTFIRQASVMRYLGAAAPKTIAYGVASVSGSILAVCSCTVLPLFGGIWRMGAGLGPATAFLYSGPAINVLAIVLTARVLGVELGIARAVGAVTFSIVIGLSMHFLFRKEEREKAVAQAALPVPEAVRPLWQTAACLALMAAILVFANWGKPASEVGIWRALYAAKWAITSVCAIALGVILAACFGFGWWKIALAGTPAAALAALHPHEPVWAFAAGFMGLSAAIGSGNGEMKEWFDVSWEFAKQILPLLLGGVLMAGFLLGRPDHEGVIPSAWVTWAVGGNSVTSNFLAALIGALMYFATLTEVPLLQGLIGSGMGKGPALALLLAGPALSLPNMLVIYSVMGFKKTFAYCSLVVILSAIAGIMYGAIG
ncbi:MAG TPA: permease [Candidatus Hydrogenedentes bacterium]|nr:permease [Candidatus Hydrogenedentota bacterium]